MATAPGTANQPDKGSGGRRLQMPEAFKWLGKHLFEFVTLVLAIAAIAFAARQYIDSSALLGKVEGLLSSASTRYINRFPQDISGISDIMTETCAELDIMVSVPGYGQYSSPDDFDAYRMTLEKVAHSRIRDNMNTKKCLGKKVDGAIEDETRPKVKLLLFDPATRKDHLGDQFGPMFLENLKSNTAARDRFIRFFQRNPSLGVKKPEEYLNRIVRDGCKDFIDKMDGQHHWHEGVFHRNDGIEIRYAKTPYQVYLWLQDQQEAAFTFDHKPVQQAPTLITFRTRDNELLKAFRVMFDEEWTHATPYDDYWKQGSGH